MLIWLAIFLMFIGLLLSIYSYLLSKQFRIYTYLKLVFIANIIVGLTYFIHEILYAVSPLLYIKFWVFGFLGTIFFVIEVVLFVHGNINEILKKVLPTTPGITILLPMLLLSARDYVPLTPGTGMAIAMAGITLALVFELLYGVTRIYGYMKGGKLFSFWQRLLILAVWFVVAGFIYTTAGIFAMTDLMSGDMAYLLVSFAYFVKSALIIYISQFYVKQVDPLIKALEEL